MRPERATGPTESSAPEVSHRLRALGLVLTAVHLTVIGLLILRPVSVSWTYPANLTPFASVDQALRIGGSAGVRQLAAGLLPLAPLGFLLPMAGGRLRAAWLGSFLRTVGGAALLATGLEILRSWVPGHVLNVDNILLGIIGVALCHLAAVPLGRALLPGERPAPTRARTTAARPRTYELAAPAPGLTGLSPSGTSTHR